MADNYDTTIKVGMEADLSGGMQTEKQLDRLKAKSRELGKEGASAGANMTAAFGKVSRAASMFQKVLTGFGIAGAFAGIIAAIDKIRASFGSAKKEAEAFAAAKAKAEHKEAVDALAKSYEALAEATRNAAEAAKHANEMTDIAVKNARELEDAQLDLAEQQELAAVDASDPAANELRAQISARYASRRGRLTASRGREDIMRERARLQDEADAKRRSAEGIVASTGEDDRIIGEARRRLADAEKRSKVLNYKDVTGFWSGFGTDLKRLATLNWGEMYETKTEKGNAIREKAAAEAKEIEAEVKRLEEQKKAKLKEAEKLRQEAKQLDDRRDAVGGGRAVVDAREQVAALTNRRGVEAADRSLQLKEQEIAKKEAKAAADAATIQAGPGRMAAIRQRIAAAEAQKQAAISADAKEQQDAVLAQQALDSFNMGGHRRNGTGVQAQRSALEADVARETQEADQSRAQLQSTLATLAATLKGLNADLKKVEREVDAATKRQAAVNDEVPGG